MAPVIDNVPKVSSLIRGVGFASHYPKSTNHHYCGIHAIVVMNLSLILWHCIGSGRIRTCMLKAQSFPTPPPGYPTGFTC